MKHKKMALPRTGDSATEPRPLTSAKEKENGLNLTSPGLLESSYLISPEGVRTISTVPLVPCADMFYWDWAHPESHKHIHRT